MGITIFKTEDEAITFLNEQLSLFDLSYVPEDIKKDILHDASGHISLLLILGKIEKASSDILNELNKEVGAGLLNYMEYNAKRGAPNGT